MKLTILGSCAASPAADRACSGYLVEEGQLRVLLDCGTGVLSNLQKLLTPEKVTDIVISHMHFDHFVDLIPFGYRRLYGPPAVATTPPRLHLPPGGKGVLAGILAQVDAGADFFDRAFQVTEYDPLVAIPLGALQLAFARVPHYVPSFAVAVTHRGGATLVYSSDGGPSEALRRLAAGADLLLCEAALEAPEPPDKAGHMTAVQAAHLTKEASVRRLVLTHFWPWQDRARALAEASAIFGEGVAIAEEGASYLL